MIRWIERTDAYRLSVNRIEDGVAHTLLGLGLGLLGLSTSSCSIGLVLVPLFLLRALVLLLQRGWIEVPLRGGPVRWQGGIMEAPSETVQVRRFDVSAAHPSLASSFPRFNLVAILQDGRILLPFKGLSAADPRVIDRVAKQLNEALGISPEEERLSAAPDLIETWRGSGRSARWTPVLVLLLLLILAALLLPALAFSR